MVRGRTRKESNDGTPAAVATKAHQDPVPKAADPPPAGVRPLPGNQAMSALIAAAQTKLQVGAAGDRYEREADDVARRVVAAVNSPVGNRTLDQVTEAPDGVAAPVARRIQRRPAVGGAGGPVDNESESLIRRERAAGQPLPDRTRQQMESAFGADFSDVRLHNGARADELSGRLSARAFTVGSDVFFRGGSPQVGTQSGMELVAHELTHVVQQGGAATGVQRAFDPDNADFAEITEVKFIAAGASNKGVFEIKGGGGSWLVAKFTNEAISKADKFADTVMSGVGIENRAAAALSSTDPRFTQLCQQLTAVGGKATSDFMINKGTTSAQGVQLMKRVPGVDMSNQLTAGGTSAANDKQTASSAGVIVPRDDAVAQGGDLTFDVLGWMAKPAFVRNLGKLAIADVLIGNQDRFSIVMNKGGKAAATFNPANFKIWGDGVVGAFDHDTVAFSQELFENKTQNADPNAWVNTIIAGETFSGAVAVRPMPSLGALFTDAGQKALYSVYLEKIEMYMADADKAAVQRAISQADFCKYLRAGYADALTSISKQAASLRTAAKDMGAESDGLLDPATIDIKLAFLESKAKDIAGKKGDKLEAAMSNNAAAEKAAQAAADVKLLVSGKTFWLDPAYQQVPQRPGKMWPHEKLDRKVKSTGRTTTDKKGNTVASDAQDIRKEAQADKLDPAFLGKLDANIARLSKGTDRRDQFAVFELKLLKFVQYVDYKRDDFMRGYRAFENSHQWPDGDRKLAKSADLDGKATGALQALKTTGQQYLSQLGGSDKQQKKRLVGVLSTLDYPLVGIARKAKGMK